jgi:hypothetical protein
MKIKQPHLISSTRPQEPFPEGNSTCRPDVSELHFIDPRQIDLNIHEELDS